jgi:hypothetical protein
VPVVVMRIVDYGTIYGASGALKTKLQQIIKSFGMVMATASGR